MAALIEFAYHRWRSLSGLALTAITIGSLVPLPELPALPGTDKTHHLVSYAALALPIALRAIRGWVWIIVLACAWSGLIEVIQPLVNRYGEWPDLLANSVGLIIGTVIGVSLRPLVPRSSILPAPPNE